MGAHRVVVADDLRPGCCAVEMMQAGASRYDWTARRRVPAQPAAIRCHDRRRHAHQQDGPALRKVYDQMTSRAG